MVKFGYCKNKHFRFRIMRLIQLLPEEFKNYECTINVYDSINECKEFLRKSGFAFTFNVEHGAVPACYTPDDRAINLFAFNIKEISFPGYLYHEFKHLEQHIRGYFSKDFDLEFDKKHHDRSYEIEANNFANEAIKKIKNAIPYIF